LERRWRKKEEKKKDAYGLLMWKSAGKICIERPRCRNACNMKMDLGEVGWVIGWAGYLCLSLQPLQRICEQNNEPLVFLKYKLQTEMCLKIYILRLQKRNRNQGSLFYVVLSKIEFFNGIISCILFARNC
jgi:hypothetical protein